MLRNYPNLISELPIRIIRPDIQYPTDITHIISESDIRIIYPNLYRISKKISGYPKIIFESLSDCSRPVGIGKKFHSQCFGHVWLVLTCKLNLITRIDNFLRLFSRIALLMRFFFKHRIACSWDGVSKHKTTKMNSNLLDTKKKHHVKNYSLCTNIQGAHVIQDSNFKNFAL